MVVRRPRAEAAGAALALAFAARGRIIGAGKGSGTGRLVNALARLCFSAVVTASYVGARFRPLPVRHPRLCNICGYEGPFGPGGKGTRSDARCPRCGSVERGRLFKLWLESAPSAIAGKRVLHFAPNKSLAGLLRPLAGHYESADIAPGRADLVLDIEAIDLPDASVDAVICFHVLEHVDDRKALAELHRLLRPGGVAAIAVPIVEGWQQTYENPGVTTPSARAFHFGQSDHVRQYGADLRTRIAEAGFALRAFTASPEEVLRHGLIRGETIFLAHR